MNSAEIGEKFREAACLGNGDIVNDLIQSGADVNSRNTVNGWTALHWAAKRGHVSILSRLLASGANKDLENEKGEKAVDVASSKDVILILGGDPTTLTDKAGEQSLPIVPNYMSNPVFPYGGSGDQVPYTNNPLPNHSEAHQNHHQSYSAATSKAGQCEEELVLKVRVANASERDFIEIEMLYDKLTYENLMCLMCQELQVHRSLITKIRKLPDTILRKDKDIARLKCFQELEVVLSNKYISESSRNYTPTVSPRSESIFY